jgi:hypothetical protein
MHGSEKLPSLEIFAQRFLAVHNQAVEADVVLARGMAHAKFDRIWKSGVMTRTEAYRWLQTVMRLPKHRAHMQQMDAQQCKAVIAHVEKAFPWL